MPENKRKFFSGRSVEQAVMAAASHYGLEPAQLAYREIEKRHGFVRTPRKAVIAVDPESPKKSSTEPESPAPPAPAEAPPERSEPRRERSSTAPSSQSEERPDRPQRGRPERSERSGRSESTDSGEMAAEQPDQPDQTEQPERPERPEGPERRGGPSDRRRGPSDRRGGAGDQRESSRGRRPAHGERAGGRPGGRGGSERSAGNRSDGEEATPVRAAEGERSARDAQPSQDAERAPGRDRGKGRGDQESSRGKSTGRDRGRSRGGRGNGPSAQGTSSPGAPSPPWWHAEPVERDEEEMLVIEDVSSEDFDEEDEVQEEQGGRPERFRHIERSEGLQRRDPSAAVREEPRPAARGGEDAAEEPRRGSRGRRGGRKRDERAPRDGRPSSRGDSQPEEKRAAGGGRDRGNPPAPREAAPPPAPVVRVPRAERLERADDALAEAAQRALDLVFGFIEVESEADFFIDEERLEIELWGPDDHILLANDGQLLLALEHLLPRMLHSFFGDTMAVRVDCNDFHGQREDRLRELAMRTAEEVRRRGRPWTLEELDPAERRIVHMSLADDPSVTTESVGHGYFKRLKVIPS